MPERLSFLARLLLIGGGFLAIAGLVLWFALPIHSTLPPYLITALLAGGYGGFCWKRSRSSRAGKS